MYNKDIMIPDLKPQENFSKSYGYQTTVQIVQQTTTTNGIPPSHIRIPTSHIGIPPSHIGIPISNN